MYGGRVMHYGPYDGREIDEVVEVDPAYILEAAQQQGHGISQQAISRARQLLDNSPEWEADDDFFGYRPPDRYEE